MHGHATRLARHRLSRATWASSARIRGMVRTKERMDA